MHSQEFYAKQANVLAKCDAVLYMRGIFGYHAIKETYANPHANELFLHAIRATVFMRFGAISSTTGVEIRLTSLKTLLCREVLSKNVLI